MDRFHELGGEAQAITVSKRVYKQVPLYVRGKRVYAKHGAGYVALIKVRKTVKTTAPDTVVEEFDLGDRKYKWNKYGQLELIDE